MEKFIIATLRKDGGYGFADSYFRSGSFYLHANDCAAGLFDTLNIGDAIGGEIVESVKGQRIVGVVRAK